MNWLLLGELKKTLERFEKLLERIAVALEKANNIGLEKEKKDG